MAEGEKTGGWIGDGLDRFRAKVIANRHLKRPSN